MDLTPQQLDSLHEGYKSLTAAPAEAGSSHSTRKRPGS